MQNLGGVLLASLHNSHAQLGEAMSQHEEALRVLQANLALMRRHWPLEAHNILGVQTNIAACIDELGRHDEALALERENYASWVALLGGSHRDTISAGLSLAISMNKLGLTDESIPFLRDGLPAAR